MLRSYRRGENELEEKLEKNTDKTNNIEINCSESMVSEEEKKPHGGKL